MTFKAASTASSNFKRPDPVAVGTYPARLVQVIDLGVQPRRPYKGEPKEPIHMVRTTYELTTEFMKNEDGTDDVTRPRWISEDFAFYPLSGSEEHTSELQSRLHLVCRLLLEKKKKNENKKKNKNTFNLNETIAVLQTCRQPVELNLTLNTQ